MAKLTVLAAMFAALFVVATAYRTTVTTVVMDDEVDNERRTAGGRCSQQIQRQQQLFHCQQFLTQQAGGRRSVIGMRGIDDVNPEHLQQCCQQLRQVEEQCRCEGIEQIVQRQQQQGRLQGQQLREVIQTAQELPNMCRISPQRCSIRVTGGGY